MEKDPISNEFVHKYSRLVYIAIRNRAKKYGFSLSHDEISDIRQDIFASIVENNALSTIKNTTSLPYWLAIVSGNAAMQYLRRTRRREPIKPISLSETIGETELADLIPSSTPDPAETMQKKELSEKIAAAIESLPVTEKLIAKLSLIHGKKQKEIAEMLRIPPGTVSTYIMRAKAKLRDLLKDFR